MSKQLFFVTLAVGSVASIGNLQAQDNQNNNRTQPASENRTVRLEQGEQDLKDQVDQLRAEVTDLQDRMDRLEGGQRPAQAPPRNPGGKSSETRTLPNQKQNAGTGQEQSGQEQSFDIFYQGLQSGGHWFDDPTYGNVWQPDVAVSDENWRPYSDGHWAYTDKGWTWISNEDFGWATYHYGRWARRTDSGWIWIPGSEWAPAWVSWREGSDHVGWAPLPPEAEDNSLIRVEGWADNYYDIGPSAYVFVSVGDLARPTYRDVIAPLDQNVAFITETKNVTNITNEKNGVTVNGPAYEQIASRTRIPQYKLHYTTQAQGKFGISTRGNELQVMAPPGPLQRNATLQPKVEKQLAKANLDRGWQQIDQAKATELRRTMEKQAPVPANLPKPTIQNQSAKTTSEQQPGGKPATPAPPNQPPPPATQRETPAGASPSRTEGAPPRPEATPARSGTGEQHPPAPASEKSRQMGAPTPGAVNRNGEEPPQRATPSLSQKRSVEQRGQSQEPAPPSQSPSVEPRNQPTEKSSSREQLKKENQGPNQPSRHESNEAPKRAEPGSRPSGNEQENTLRQRQENRGEEPNTKNERPAESKSQPEGGRAVEKNQGNNTDRNNGQMREGATEETPRKAESPSKPRGNQREKQDTE